jgi:hypothetical protein
VATHTHARTASRARRNPVRLHSIKGCDWGVGRLHKIAPNMQTSDVEGKSVAPSLVDVAIAAAWSGPTDGVRGAALRLLLDLCDVLSCDTPDLVDVTLASAASGGTDGIRAMGLGILHTLASTPETRALLFSRPTLVDVALAAATSVAPNKAKLAGMRLLQKLAVVPENAIILYFKPDLVDSARGAAASSQAANELRYAGLGLLGNLAFDVNLAFQLVQLPGMLDACVACTFLPNAHAGMVLLHAFSRAGAALRLLDTREVVIALAAGLENESDVVQTLATMAIANILGKDAGRSSMLAARPECLRSLICVLKASLSGEDRQKLFDSLQAISSLCFVPAYRAFFFKNNLFMFLIAGLGKALETDDPACVEYAASSLYKFCVDADALLVLRADPTLSGLLKSIKGLPRHQAKWTSAKCSADSLDFYISPSAPDSEGIGAWLEEAGIGSLYGVLVREGFASAKSLASLSQKSAVEIGGLLRIGGGDAMELENALKGKWV